MREDWTLTTIGEACRLVNGGTPKTKVPEYWDGEHQWITPADMGGRSTPYVAETARALTDAGLQNSSARLLPPQSLILSSRAPIGYLAINTEPMAFNQGCKGLIPGEGLDHKYLFYYLTSIVDLLNSLGTGATFKELSGGKLKSVPLPRPSLPEQKRIVAILDEAFAGIAAAVANAEKNLANARELFETHLSNAFVGLRRDYEEKKLKEICDKVTVGYVGPMVDQYRGEGVPFLRSKNVRPFEIDRDDLKFISPKFNSVISKSALRPGDVAIVRTGYPGTAAVIPDDLPGANCSDLVIARPGQAVDGHYLAHFLNSGYGKSLVRGRLTGAAQKHFNVTAAKEVPVPLPDVGEQRRVIDELHRMRASTGQLQRSYIAKESSLERLRQSILQKAFSGELTAKEADRDMAAA